MTQRASFEHLKFSSPEIWREVIKVMGEIEALVWDDPLVTDDLTRAEGVRQLTRLIAGGFPITMEMIDPDYPQFLQLLSTRVQWGLPSADCHYVWAPLHGDNVYRIVGDRGTARVIDLEVREDHIAHLGDWKLFHRLQELEVGPNNQVEIIASRERPTNAANWLQLPEGPCNVIFRNYFYDWDTEQAARLTIITEGKPYPPPALTENAIRRNLELFCDLLREMPAGFRQTVGEYYRAPTDKLSFDGINYGFASLSYGKSTYDIADDEALILEIELPKTKFWNIQIGSHFWEARDYHLRQTSLNGHQAHIDNDGVFRAVISHKDPGVANWLDTGGHSKGLITVRYFEAESILPTRIQRTKLSQVAALLPQETAQVSAEERQRILQKRAWSFPRIGRE
ncbi:MAG: DUF1214 domain-containing protein [Porticoccaceae bacterium]|nr:DUF1214 domain-containing protein [Porticoccaceae bacterium]